MTIPVEAAMEVIADLWDEAVVNGSDQYGDATPAVYAISTEEGSSAKTSYTTVLTAIIERPLEVEGLGPLRVSVVLTWVPTDDDFDLVYLLKAYHQGDDWLNRASETKARMPV